jgi:hypothetical protein
MSTDEQIEQEIQDKGLTAPRVKPEDIERAIQSADYIVWPGTMLTICCLTLQNGFTVTGESACASPENFNPEVGERVSRLNAKAKIWPLEGYLLKQRLHEGPTAQLHKDAFEALHLLATNPHLDLGDLVYTVREKELKGWDGPAVTQWGTAVAKVIDVMKRAKELATPADDIPF